MNSSFQNKVEQLKKLFLSCKTQEERYELLIELGKKLPLMKEEHKNENTRVHGCQSTTYLYTHFKEDKLFFEASSDALISAGLAALLITIYNEEPPQTLLKEEPKYLKDLGIEASLSPNRANGLYEMFLKMQKDALQFLKKN